jgi:hypothetical protein
VAFANSPKRSSFLDVFDGCGTIGAEGLLNELPVDSETGIPVSAGVVFSLLNTF